jgi:diguanylate cyclase (GGDEF)-like protein
MGHAAAPKRARLIWGISGAGAVLTGLLFLAFVETLAAPSHHLPFLGVAAMFAIAAIAVVPLEVGSQRHPFSLVEVPLVLGLLTLQPKLLVAAWLLGGAFTLTVVRRQTPIKLAYNLAGFALQSVVAVLIFHMFSNGRDVLGGSTFAGLFVAALVSSLIRLVSVFVAVALTEGAQPRDEMIRHLLFGSVSTAVTTSTMLLGVVLEQTDPNTLWLLAMPIAGVYLAQRAFTNQLREHRRLTLLRQSTQLVAGLGTEESVGSLLRQICHTLNTEVAALTYVPVDVPDSLAVAAHGPDDQETPLHLVAKDEYWDSWTELAPGRDPRILSGANDAGRLGRLIGHAGLRQAMVVPLCGDLSVIGYLTVADRRGDANPFSLDDLEVIDALERFVSMGLENGHLERSMQEAQLLERQLVHRATHDSLTGLANRTLLADHLSRRLSEARGSEIACLFIDLDDFKAVNDRFGHPTGDQLLVVTAQRLVGCLRDGDIAARLGGDELAVVAHVDPANHRAEAAALAQRILASLSRPASLGEHTVSATASIGIVLARPGHSAAEVLADADAAMYGAKAAGKGGVQIFKSGRRPNRARS